MNANLIVREKKEKEKKEECPFDICFLRETYINSK